MICLFPIIKLSYLIGACFHCHQGLPKDHYELEIQNMKRQLEFALKERDELEVCF